MRRFFGQCLIWILILPFTFMLALRLVRPARRPFTSHPRDFAALYEEVTFPGPAGTISGWYLPGMNGRTLIGLHGIGDNKQQWLPVAVALQRRGYTTLLIDFRAHGASAGRYCTYGDLETQDVAAALTYLAERGDVALDHIGVMGLSLGGITAIIAAARLPALRAVVAEAAFSDLFQNLGLAFSRFTGVPAFPFANLTVFWAQLLTGTRLRRLRPVAVVGAIAPRPVYIIGDLADQLVNEPEASTDLYHHAGEPKNLWQIAGAAHVAGYAIAQEEYVERLDAFFARALVG